MSRHSLDFLEEEEIEDNHSPPSYVIVQQQLRDLLTIQETTIGNLAQANVDTLNASRNAFSSTLQCKENKIVMLQRYIEEDLVSKEEYQKLYEKVKTELVPKRDFEDLELHFQDECKKHAQTQETLQNVVYQLATSSEKIKSLEEEAESNQDAFDVERKELKDQIGTIQARNNLLQAQLNEKLMLCEQQQDEISRLLQQVENLQHSKQNQSKKHKQQLRESEVEKQQEAYLQRMMADIGGKCHKKI